jgi:glycosyltransferase involved in cell wall biosynthesis
MLSVTHVFSLSEKPGRHVWGGAERHLRILLPALASAGVSVEAVILVWNRGNRLSEGVRELVNGGVHVKLIYRSVPCWYRPRIVCAASVLLRLLPHLFRARASIVHVHLSMVFVPVIAIIAGCRRLVITLHNDERYWSGWVFRNWLNLLSFRVNHYIAISSHVRLYAAALLPRHAHRISVVRYGVPVPERSTNTRRDFDLQASDFVVGFVGRLTDQKNLPVLVRALQKNPDVRGVIIGSGAGMQLQELQALARSINAHNVSFHPAMENAAGLMPLFDVLCLPSKWEGLGLVLVEAMLQAVPVIGSRQGAIPEVLAGGEAGDLFDFEDVDALAGLIRDAHSNSSSRRKKVDAASLHAREHFSVRAMVVNTTAVYQSIAGPITTSHY